MGDMVSVAATASLLAFIISDIDHQELYWLVDIVINNADKITQRTPGRP
jgi:hypothetical protein